MTIEQAKSEIMQIYGALSPDKQRAIDTLMKIEPCEDCISRKSIKQKLQEHHDFFVNAYGGFSNLPQNDKSRVDEITNCIAMVVNEPPVNPQEPKTGHWTHDGSHWKNRFICSKCGYKLFDEPTNYCPYCGVRVGK